MKTLLFVLVVWYGTPDDTTQPRVLNKTDDLEQCLYLSGKLNKLPNTHSTCVVVAGGIEL